MGSKAIAAEMGGKVSSATIRNELADLADLGYLEQPHTSAGRVPSPKGYRLYVNELMERQKLSIAETEKINRSLQLKMEELDRVISQAGRAVSSFVNYPCLLYTSGVVFRTKGLWPAVCVPHPAAACGNTPSSVRHSGIGLPK